MGGVIGVLSFHGPLPVSDTEALLRHMAGDVERRPQRGARSFVRGAVALSGRRLAPTHPDAQAEDPIALPDKSFVASLDGEIFNLDELRRELRYRGVEMRTGGVREALLHGYRLWGRGLLAKLRGAFAFAIWDADRREMVIARDRFGERPLYYYQDERVFVTASDVKSLLLWPGLRRTANVAALHDFMSFEFAPGDDTAFLGVKRVPPAHVMTISRDGRVYSEQYWRLSPVDPGKARMSRRRAARQLIDRFDEALRLRSGGGAPLGTIMQGGLGGGVVAARLARLTNQPVQTFAAGFLGAEEPFMSEMKSIAQRHGARHRAFIMDDSIVEALPKMIWHCGEPYADPMALVDYAMSRQVRRYAGVVIAADGSDELLLNRRRYAALQALAQARAAGQALPEMPEHVIPEMGGALMRDRFTHSLALFDEDQKQRGYGPAMVEHLFFPSADRIGRALEDVSPENALDAASRVDCEHFLSERRLGMRGAAMTAAGLQTRNPFLDHVFADWVASLPVSLRAFERRGRGAMAGLMKLAMDRDLPERTLSDTPSRLEAPVDRWLRTNLKEYAYDALTSRAFRERGFFEPSYVRWMLDRHFLQQANHGRQLWGLLSLELWHQTFIDPQRAGALTVSVTGLRTRLEGKAA